MLRTFNRRIWQFLPALAALSALSTARADVYVTVGNPTTGGAVGVMKYNDDGSGGVMLFSTTSDSSPRGLTVGPDGALYVCFAGNGVINRYDSNTGALLGAFIAKGAGGLIGPITLRFYDNLVYVSDFGTSPAVQGGPYNGQVLKFKPNGTFVAQIVAPIPSGGHFPGIVSAYGLDFDADGNIDVGMPDGGLATEASGTAGWGCGLGYSPTGKFLDITANSNLDPGVGSSPPNFAVRGIAFSPDKSLLFAALENAELAGGTDVGAVGVYDAVTHDVKTYIGPDAYINEPRSLGFGPVDGNLYVVSTATTSTATAPGSIQVYNGTAYTHIGAFATGLTLPYDIAFRQLTSLTSADLLLIAGATTHGTVTLSAPAGAGGLTVALSSSNTADITLPATVVVPAGELAGTFVIKAAKTAKVGSVIISASYTKTTQPLTLNIITTKLSALTVTPTTVAGGATATGEVTLSAAAPAGGYTVKLSSNSTLATVPASVMVAAGSKTATFTVTTKAFKGNNKVVTITAEFAGTSKSVTLTVEP